MKLSIKEKLGYTNKEITRAIAINETHVCKILKLHNESLNKENNAKKDS